MNTQTHLSPADAAELEAYRQRQRQLDREVRGFFAELAARYGNPAEDLSVGPDNALIRTLPKPDAKGRKRLAKEK